MTMTAERMGLLITVRCMPRMTASPVVRSTCRVPVKNCTAAGRAARLAKSAKRER
jgi:hypothetical protein